MKKLGVAAFVAGAFYVAGSGAASSQPSTDFNKMFQDAPSIYASVNVLTLQRGHPSGGTTVGGNPGGTPSFRTARDFDFGWNTGIDATVGVRFWRTEALEVRFMNFETRSGDSFVTPGAFIGAGFTGPGGTTFQGAYETKMESWEVNWRHQMSGQFTVLAGVRHINLNDMMFYKLNGNVATGKYNYRNDLLGAQIGAEWAIMPVANPFQVNVFGKAGLYRLHTEGGIYEYQGNNFIGSFTANEKENVYGAEAGVMLGYRISNTVMLRAGYQVIWLNDLGLAGTAASVSLLNPSLLREVRRDDLVLHGFNFGMAIAY
jgi:hypothetical protein